MSTLPRPIEDKATETRVYQCGFAIEKPGGEFHLGELAYRGDRLDFETNYDGAIAEYIKGGGEFISPATNLRTFVDIGCLKLPSFQIDPGTDPIAPKVAAFIRKYADVPPDWPDIDAHYILMTWVFDRFSAVPYLRFLGESGTGKTRLLEIHAALCYRPLFLVGNVTGAALFRSINLVQGTLVSDESDLKSSEAWSDVVKVLNNGYSRGGSVIRCNKDNGYATEAFAVYGPKVIATRGRFSDDALENRCLTRETIRKTPHKDIPLQLPPEFYREAQKLRNQLLGWRFRKYSQIRPDDSGLRHLPPRLAQIGASLIAVGETPEAKAGLIEFLNRYNAEAQESSETGLVEQIAKELITKEPIKVSKIADEANLRLGFELDYTGEWFLEDGESKPLTPKRVGGILRSLGYKTTRKRLGYLAHPLGELG